MTRAFARAPREPKEEVMTGLLRRDRREGDELNELRARITEMDALRASRDREIDRLRADLTAFKLHYRHHVGTLYDQLDELEDAIADAELGELAAQVSNAAPASDPPATPRPTETPRFTSDAIRRLFRDVAKAIHPDLARDDCARERRHALMAEANRAYADGDETQLRLILQAWERSPEAVPGNDAFAIRLRLIRRIGQLEEQLAALQIELDELRASPLWLLKANVDEASAKGRDLVSEMVTRLKRDIMAATNRLAAMRPPN
jgi:hypothetical protein